MNFQLATGSITLLSLELTAVACELLPEDDSIWLKSSISTGRHLLQGFHIGWSVLDIQAAAF